MWLSFIRHWCVYYYMTWIYIIIVDLTENFTSFFILQKILTLVMLYDLPVHTFENSSGIYIHEWHCWSLKLYSCWILLGILARLLLKPEPKAMVTIMNTLCEICQAWTFRGKAKKSWGHEWCQAVCTLLL